MPGDLDAGHAGHPEVEDGDLGLAELDLLDRVSSVTRPAGDLDPVLAQDVGHGFDDRGVVIGDKARRDRRPLRHGALGCRFWSIE
jgi:hypothetical protein